MCALVGLVQMVHCYAASPSIGIRSLSLPRHLTTWYEDETPQAPPLLYAVASTLNSVIVCGRVACFVLYLYTVPMRLAGSGMLR
jgi:hypothetical protein